MYITDMQRKWVYVWISSKDISGRNHIYETKCMDIDGCTYACMYVCMCTNGCMHAEGGTYAMYVSLCMDELQGYFLKKNRIYETKRKYMDVHMHACMYVCYECYVCMRVCVHTCGWG